MKKIVKMKEKFIGFSKKEPVLVVAGILAIITCFFVPIDKEYLNYFDCNTLVSLFCMLIVVAGLKNTGLFDIISIKLIRSCHNRRTVIYALVFGTFFFDMIVANDMSLITFLPLTYIVLHSTNNDIYLAFTFVLQTIAANMGGMITPYGNPQNLYLYSYYNIPTKEFFGILFVQSLCIAILLFLSCLLIKPEPLRLKKRFRNKLNKKLMGIYIVLFFLVILSIFRIIPHYFTLAVVVITIIILDKSRFKDVDYALLATFCVFFIFSGNIARIDAIKNIISGLVLKNTLLAGIISCQFISNVPTAIFLSKFTTNYKELLISVNIGSLGIIISSLASLITLKEFLKHQPKNFKKYMTLFTIYNTTFLIVMLIVTKCMKI